MWPLGEVDVSVEQARIGIILSAIFTIINCLVNGISAYFNGKNKTAIELAKIEAERAKTIAQINADQSRKAHAELTSKVEDIQATLNAGT